MLGRTVVNGMIWVCWPKKASKLATDLDENVIRDFALASGVVDVKVAAVDATWSGLKPCGPVTAATSPSSHAGPTRSEPSYFERSRPTTVAACSRCAGRAAPSPGEQHEHQQQAQRRADVPPAQIAHAAPGRPAPPGRT